MTNEQDLVMEALEGKTKEEPLTRYQLRNVLHMNDVQCRSVIGQLRDQGVRVIGTSNVNGYWLANSEEEYDTFRQEYMRKATTILKRVKAMDMFLNGQETM